MQQRRFRVDDNVVFSHVKHFLDSCPFFAHIDRNQITTPKLIKKSLHSPLIFSKETVLYPTSATHDGSLAQPVEQQAFNLLVLRSNRRRPTI